MMWSKRTGLKAVLLLAFLLHVCDAVTSKRVDQLSEQEVEEELEVCHIMSTRAAIEMSELLHADSKLMQRVVKANISMIELPTRPESQPRKAIERTLSSIMDDIPLQARLSKQPPCHQRPPRNTIYLWSAKLPAGTMSPKCRSEQLVSHGRICSWWSSG